MRLRKLGRRYRDGETIVRQGEPGYCMYVIQSGRVEVVRDDGDGETRLGTLGAGDFFGEGAVFDTETRRPSTVRAVGDVQVLTVEKVRLLRRIREDPLLAAKLVESLAKRNRELSEEVSRLRARLDTRTATDGGAAR